MKSVVALLFLLPFACGPNARSGGTLYVNTKEAFSLRPPRGWTVHDTSFRAGRVQGFAIACNSAAAAIAPEVKVHAGGRWPPVFMEQIPPRGAIVVFTHFAGGPGFSGPHCAFQADTVGDGLAPLVDTLQVKNRWHGRSGVAFRKWGNLWGIEVFTRDPTRADRRAIKELLRSIAFPRAPVVSEGQASQLAYEALPPEARVAAPAGVTRCFNVDVTQSDSLFRVDLRRGRSQGGLAETLTDSVHAWSYWVHLNGRVERVQ